MSINFRVMPDPADPVAAFMTILCDYDSMTRCAALDVLEASGFEPENMRTVYAYIKMRDNWYQGEYGEALAEKISLHFIQGAQRVYVAAVRSFTQNFTHDARKDVLFAMSAFCLGMLFMLFLIGSGIVVFSHIVS